MENSIYDIIIIGAGVSGVFSAYSLLQKHKNIKILLIDKGSKLDKRICPIEEKNISSCVNCSLCNKLFGFSGLGRSEGKFNFTNDFGGEIGEKIGMDKANLYFKEVENILRNFSSTSLNNYFTYHDEFNNLCLENFIKPLFSNVFHLGLRNSINIFSNLYEFLKDKIDISLNTEVLSIEKVRLNIFSTSSTVTHRKNNFYPNHNEKEIFKISSSDKKFFSKKVILATGEASSTSTDKLLSNLEIYPIEKRVDIGIRVETPIKNFEDILSSVPEFKIKSNEGAYTYCMNPYGYVIHKHQYGLPFADGQNFRERGAKSKNINFTIFVPKYFESWSDAKLYLNEILLKIDKSKKLSLGEFLKDLRNNNSSENIENLEGNFSPSLSSYKLGKLSQVLEEEIISKVLNLLESLENILGTPLNPNTILYAIDVKNYGARIKTDKNFQSDIKGFYIIGDASGETCSLSQAAVSGLHLADKIL